MEEKPWGAHSVPPPAWIGLTKIYKLGLETKKNYQGYIESENFGQSRKFCCLQNGHIKLAGLPALVYNRYKLIFFLRNGSIKIYKLGLEMKKNYQGYIESGNFGQSQCFVAFKMATEDWSAYRRVSIIAIN